MNKIVIVDIIFRLLKHDSCEMRYNGKLINCSSMNSISRAQLPLFSHHNNPNLIFLYLMENPLYIVKSVFRQLLLSIVNFGKVIIKVLVLVGFIETPNQIKCLARFKCA